MTAVIGKRATTVSACFVIAIICSSRVSAQVLPDATSDPVNSLPDQIKAAHISYYEPTEGYELVSIGIYPEAPNSKIRRPGTYYHRPLLAFIERTQAIDGYPSVVQGVSQESDGAILMDFRVLLTTLEFRTRCKEEILKQDRENALKDAGSEDKVRAAPWPIVGEVIVACRDRQRRHVLSATSVAFSTSDELAFTLPFKREAAEEFVSKVDAGNVVMDFFYHYRNVGSYRGEIAIKGSKNISIAVDDVVGSRFTSPDSSDGSHRGRPVFLEDKNRIERSVEARIERTIVAEHKDLIPLLSTQTPLLVDQLLVEEGTDGLDYDTLANKFVRFDEELKAYLRPQVGQLNSTATTSDTKIDIIENEQARQVANGKGFTLLLIGFGEASESERTRALDRLERSTGVTFGQVESSQYFQPQAVRVWRVREGYDSVSFDERTIAYLPIGRESQHIVTIAPTKFTDKIATQAARAETYQDIHNGIRRGMLVPYFGTELPKGYVWADGKTKWPPEDWVLSHLRGTAVPDMRGEMIGGASDQTDVGRYWNEGKLTFVVNGSNFTVPDGVAATSTTGTDVMEWIRGPGLAPDQVHVHNPAQDDHSWAGLRVQNGLTTNHLTYAGSLNGSQTIEIELSEKQTLPRHLMCQWIIRME